ncbi:hypothetical protein [Marinilactibacillus kalidii]|uniref:hypothetical protein n=1 Tax=Marinilactibacillus kalidii TaxID=2820274 RepID=UPI001ABDE3AF|nr:hypothetical protein [Marinilactibacillus kalidii]
MTKITITKRDALIYLGMLIIVGVSININLAKDDNVRNIIMNFLPGLGFAFMGLSVEHKDIGKKFRITLLVLACLFFGYISLYYLIGFHNHHWGN